MDETEEVWSRELAGRLVREVMQRDEQMREMPETGLPAWREKHLSPIFVRNYIADFATLSTTVLIVHKSGKAYFKEISYRHNRGLLEKLGGTLGCYSVPYATASEKEFDFVIKQ